MKVINGMEMYNTQDMAKMLGVNARTVIEYRKQGKIKWVQVGHERMTSKANFEAFLNGETLEGIKASARLAKVLENLK